MEHKGTAKSEAILRGLPIYDLRLVFPSYALITHIDPSLVAEPSVELLEGSG